MPSSGLLRACNGDTVPTAETHHTFIEGLFTTITNVSFDDEAIRAQIEKTHAEKERLVPQCCSCGSPCGRNNDYDMKALWSEGEDVRSLKSLILFGLRGMPLCPISALMLGYTDDAVNRFFAEGLLYIGEEMTVEQLLPHVLKVGEINLKCMALLDKANTETYGTPVPVTVPMSVEKGPFIVVTGHDLKDLQLLLEQTNGKGINIYTHGEMLPAHAYPELKKYPHLKGNFWHRMAEPAKGV